MILDLFDNPTRIVSSAETQIDLFKAITVLKKLSQARKLTLQIRVMNKKRKFLQNKKIF